MCIKWIHVEGNIQEEAVTYTAMVELSNTAQTVIYVNYSTQPYTAEADKDYVSVNGTLVWGAGQNGKREITVSIIDDKVLIIIWAKPI